jgi:NodT family efflux transporter outer membrane factor (OMF) lipoprotein
MRRIAITFALAALVVGCATKPPPSREEVRQQALGHLNLDRPWKAGSAPGDTVQDDWLATFQDPALDALVREAIANNPDLRVAAARVEQSAQYLVIAKAALKPWLQIFGTGGAKAGGGGDTSSALQGIVAAASWELDLWGRVRYGRNAAQDAYASAQADFEYARQSLAAAVAKAWFTATQLSLNTAIAEGMVQSSRLLQGFAEDRERVGAGTDADTAVARANVHTAEDTVQQLRFARGQALRALEALLGRYPAAEVNARAELLALPGPLPVGVPLQMLERRPDVIAAERRVAAAFSRIGEAKAARLPQITLNLSFGAYESEILALREDFENPTGGAGARLVAPIYQGGRLNAQVEIRTLEQKEAVADYARIALRALNDVEDALAANDTLSRRVSLLSDAVREQSLALDLTETRFRIGRADRRAIEQQRLSVSGARMALIEVQTEQLAQRVNLHLALGGSFEQPQQQAELQ